MSSNIVSVAECFKIHFENELELHRANSFRTKEPETVQWIEQFFHDGEVFFDIGANIGIYSLFSAAKHDGMKVFSFEPFLRNFVRLIQNVELNQANGIHAFPIAISDSNRISHFYSRDIRSGASGGQIDRNLDENGVEFRVENKQPILTFSLDEITRIFKIPSPNHIKIDVDGAEDLIIQGMKTTLGNSTLRSLLIELNQNTKTRERFVKELYSLGFTLENEFHLSENHSRRRRMNNPKNKAENLIFIRVPR